jgi:superfamily II DNA helicase RecQ
MYNLADSLMKYNETYTIDYKKKYDISVVSNDEYNETNMEKEEIISIEEKIEDADKNNIQESECLEVSKIYKELKEYRLKKSREEKVKPYFLYNNQELEAIIEVKPKTIEELKTIKGFGNVKCEKYGVDIIEIVKSNL